MNKDLIISKYKELGEHSKELIKYYESFHTINSMKTTKLKEYISTLESELSLLQEQEKEPIPILTDLSEDDKRSTIDQFVRMTAKYTLQMFIMLGLKTHIEARIVNEPTKEEFIFSFKKVTEKSVDQSGIREELIKFRDYLISEWKYEYVTSICDGDIDEYLKAKER